MKKPNLRTLIRNLIIEMLIYGLLLVVYFFAVLRLLGDWLMDLFQNQLVVYSVVGLVLIVVQAVVLETVTSFLVRLLRLDRFV
jgi:hypothetical protein